MAPKRKVGAGARKRPAASMKRPAGPPVDTIWEASPGTATEDELPLAMMRRPAAAADAAVEAGPPVQSAPPAPRS